MKYKEISDANKKLSYLKLKFRWMKSNTEIIKQRIYDPNETDLDEHQWQMRNQQEIWINRGVLKNLEKEIKELRKAIKKMNREQNLKNNKHMIRTFYDWQHELEFKNTKHISIIKLFKHILGRDYLSTR